MTPFAERLRAVMGARRVSPKALAQECGVSVQLVRKWQAGTGMPKPEAQEVICRVCQCSQEWLLAPMPLDFDNADPAKGYFKALVREVLAER